MVHLQKVHERHGGRDLVVLGFNGSDDRELAEQMLAAKKVTFPNVLDSSAAAQRVSFDGYRCSGVPLNYVLDREGKVVAAFYGFREGDPRVAAALEKLGVR